MAKILTPVQRKTSSLLLLLLFNFFSIAHAQIPSDEMTFQEARILKLARNYNVWLAKGNGIVLEGLTKCIESSIKNGQIKDIPIVLTTKSVFGADLKKDLKCKDLLSEYFGYGSNTEFRRKFRTMQYAAILSQSGGEGSDSEFYDTPLASKLSKIEHPIRSFLEFIDGSIVFLPKPEPVVIEKAFATYQKSILENCEEFKISIYGQQVINRHLYKNSDQNLKAHLCKYLTSRSQSQLSFSEKFRLGPVIAGYLDTSKKKRKVFNQKHLAMYLELIKENPHFLLLEKIDPSLNEALDTLKTMKDHNNSYLNQLLNQQDSDQLFRNLDLLSSVPMTFTSLVQRHLHLSFEEAQKAIVNLKEKKRKAQLLESKIETGAILGATGFCYFFPAGRASLLFKSACNFSLGVPLVLIYTYQAVQTRSLVLDELLSTPVADYILADPQSITKSNQHLLLAILFLPLNLEVKSTKHLISVIKKSN